MGSQLRPGATGLNRVLLEKEAKLKAFLGSLLDEIVPKGYNEENTIPQGPPAPFNPLARATGMSASPTGINSRLLEAEAGPRNILEGLLGGGETAPAPTPAPDRLPYKSLPQALVEMRMNGDRATPIFNDEAMFGSSREPELPPVHNPAMAAMTGGIPPEVMQLVDELVKSGGSVPNSNSSLRMPAGPPRMAQERRPARPATLPLPNPIASPISQPSASVPPEAPFDLSKLLSGNRNLASAIPEPFVPEPFDLGPSESPRIANEEVLGREEDDPFATPETDTYLNTLRARPRHEAHEGSRARRGISGVLKGLLGGDFGIGDAPHQKALRKWSDEGAGQKEAATYEQSGLKEKRLQLADVFRQQKAQKEYELKVQQEINDYNQEKAKLERLRNKDERDQQIDLLKAKTMARLSEWRKEHSQQRINQAGQRIGLEGRRVSAYENRSNNIGDRPLDPRVQEGIEKEARRIVRNDPRFSKWYLPESDEFNSIPMRRSDGKIKRDKQGNVVMKEEMDPATREMLQRELVKAKEQVANRKRSSYSRVGFDSPFTDGSLLDPDTEYNFDFGQDFDDR